MEKFNVKILESAMGDLEEVVLYIAQDSVDDAIKAQNTFLNTIDKFSVMPKRGRLLPDKKLSAKGYRSMLCMSYIIFYRIIEGDVFVYRILHGRRNYPKLIDDMSEGN